MRTRPRGARRSPRADHFRDDDDDEATATTANARADVSTRRDRARQLEARGGERAGGLAVANIARAVPIKS